MSIPVSATPAEEQRNVVKDPFSTMAKEFVPDDIKEAFRRARIIYQSQILVLRALYKLAEYPITPIEYNVVSDENSDELELESKQYEDIYKHIFEDVIDIHQRLIEIGLDYFLYSNCFPALVLPFERVLTCKTCEKNSDEMAPAAQITGDQITDLTFDGKKFRGTCPICKKTNSEFTCVEIPLRDNYERVKLIRRNLFRVSADQAEMSGACRYTYKLSTNTIKKIKKNDRFTLDNTPFIAIEAAYKSAKAIELNDSEVYHFKMPYPTLEIDTPWSWPLIISAFQTVFFIQSLIRASEAIATDHINPLPYIAPAENIQTLLGEFDMAAIRTQLMDAYKEGQKDDNMVSVFGVPVRTGILNLQGRMFMPDPELKSAQADLLVGLGLFRGLLSGDGPYQGGSIAIRVIENGFITYRAYIQKFLNHIARKLEGHFNLPPCEIKLTEFVRLDDALHKQQLGFAVQNKWISKASYLKSIGFDAQDEAIKVASEIEDEATAQAKAEAMLQEQRTKMFDEQEIDRMSATVEYQYNMMRRNIDNAVEMIRTLIDKGYDKDFAMNYIIQYQRQQTAVAENEAARQRAMEAEAAFLRDRLANATTGLNRSENTLQMHQMMDAAMQDPAMRNLTQENSTVDTIVRQTMMMNDDDRKRFLDEMQRRQPTLWQQVTMRLGQYPGGSG